MVKEEGETVEVTGHGEIIAKVIPAHEPDHALAEDDKAAWEELKRLAAEIDARWQGDMDAVETVRDVRRDL